MATVELKTGGCSTPRHSTTWVEMGPPDGPLMIFLHGWPKIGIVWKAQLEFFARLGWRCVAPDMRGYGGSSVPKEVGAYSTREIVCDMIELHDALGAMPAVWVGHDWGSQVVWAFAAHHAMRCRAVASLCLPYFARGFAIENLLPLIDRAIYPESQYPLGQWDYMLFYREHFAQAARDLEANVTGTIRALYRKGEPEGLERAAPTASIRANGGWFGQTRAAPSLPRDTTVLSEELETTLVEAFTATGFRGANAWYLNDSSNVAFAAEAFNFGQLEMPVLFLHAANDNVCETRSSRLAEPMRSDCTNLTEVTIYGGHELMLERPHDVSDAIARWLSAHLEITQLV